MSRRSRGLWRGVLVVAVASWIVQVALGSPAWTSAAFGAPFLLLFLWFFVSRINDSWALEARERRAAARRTHSSP
jgi:hypothetical protein